MNTEVVQRVVLCVVTSYRPQKRKKHRSKPCLVHWSATRRVNVDEATPDVNQQLSTEEVKRR